MRRTLVPLLLSSLLLGCPAGQNPIIVPPPPPGGAAGPTLPSDPLGELAKKYPLERFLVARGEGLTGDEARESAKTRLVESIQSRIRGVQVAPVACEGEGCPKDFAGSLRSEVASFEHAALIRVFDPVKAPGGYQALAALERSKVAPYLEEDVKAARARLESEWRAPLRQALEAKRTDQVLSLCSAGAGPLLRTLETRRLALAVVVHDATEYRASDDLKSLLELQSRARTLLVGVPTHLVLDFKGSDPAVDELLKVLRRLATERGLKPQDSSAAAAKDGLVLRVRPEPRWSEDSGFHFLRLGLTLEGSFAGAPGTFLQYNLEGDRSKAGGVQKAHALRDSLRKAKPILETELAPKLPSLSCSLD